MIQAKVAFMDSELGLTRERGYAKTASVPEVVIVGGFAGLAAAKALKKEDVSQHRQPGVHGRRFEQMNSEHGKIQ